MPEVCFDNIKNDLPSYLFTLGTMSWPPIYRVLITIFKSEETIANSGWGKKKNISLRNEIMARKSKFHKNGKFDFLTACHVIKFDELQIRFHFCNPARFA